MTLKPRELYLALIAALALLSTSASYASAVTQAEVIVYGGTPSGIMAAVAAARHGHSVILINTSAHLGGAVSGGLCISDIGDRATVSGLSNEFFERIVSYYSATYGPASAQVTASKDGTIFEPHVAETIFNEMIREQAARITVWPQLRFKSVTVSGGRVTSLDVINLTGTNVRTFTGSIFVDASYEGDLLAGSGVPYKVGREAESAYGETLAGIAIGPDKGQGDGLVMAYNYRLSLTPVAGNRLLFPKPANYDPTPWKSLYAQSIQSGVYPDLGHLLISGFTSTSEGAGPNQKYCLNVGDDVGAGYGYPNGDWATRDAIAATHRDYLESELYYLQNDPGLPSSWLAKARQWGFSKDEFTDNGGFPFQLYVREGRRMVGEEILTLNDLTQDRFKDQGICEGSYATDCHTVQLVPLDGTVLPDSTRHLAVNDYDIPYGCLLPKTEPTNLLVSVAISATHVATCSLRMEPVYMMLGHAAGDAASLALSGNCPLQKISVNQLRLLLRSENAILDSGYTPPVTISYAPSHPDRGHEVRFQAQFGTLKSPITQMAWDMEGDGTIAGLSAGATHTFSHEKIYHVSFVAVDQAGRRRIVFADVPVGAAVPLDTTVDDLDAVEQGPWSLSYPSLGGHQHYSDVFINSGASYVLPVAGKVPLATALFQPNLLRAGHYQICFAYRPAAKQASNLMVHLTINGRVTTQTLNEQIATSPFPFVSLGTFFCKAGTGSSLEVETSHAIGTAMVDAVRWVWLGD